MRCREGGSSSAVVYARCVPSSVKANDGKLQYWACGGGCTDIANWSGVSFNSSQGEQGVDLALTPGGAVAMASGDLATTETRVCASGCATPGGSWTLTTVDSNAALEAFRPAMSAIPCGSTPAYAYWYPSAAIHITVTANRLKVLSATKLSYQCSAGGQYASMGGVVRYAEVAY